MIAVVDYKKGNLMSVERGLRAAGGDAQITSDPTEIERADAIVLPGVGAFTDAMNTMNELGQKEAIQRAVSNGVPLLGICLGLHLLYAGGEEHADGWPTQGLGFFPGVAKKMPSENEEGKKFKIPHVGWNSIEFEEGASDLLKGVAPSEYFYFTHSYIAPDSLVTVATTSHSVAFPSVVDCGNIYGVQFHPEKSSNAGAQILRNFVEIAGR